jgi:uncharacterized protein YkwD
MGIRRYAALPIAFVLGTVVGCSEEDGPRVDLEGIAHISEISSPRPTAPGEAPSRSIPTATASVTAEPTGTSTPDPTSTGTTTPSATPPPDDGEPPNDEPPDDDPPDEEPPDTPDPLDELRDEVVELTNTERNQHGCNPVEPDDRLDEASVGHSEDMADRDYFDHSSPEGVGPGERADDAGYHAWGAENIAMGYRTAEDVMEGWMNSEGHRKNILNCDLTDIGIGIADSSRGLYWTQMFGFG